MGIDCLLDMGRTVVIVTGDAMVAMRMAKLSGMLDLEVYNATIMPPCASPTSLKTASPPDMTALLPRKTRLKSESPTSPARSQTPKC